MRLLHAAPINLEANLTCCTCIHVCSMKGAPSLVTGGTYIECSIVVILEAVKRLEVTEGDDCASRVKVALHGSQKPYWNWRFGGVLQSLV